MGWEVHEIHDSVHVTPQNDVSQRAACCSKYFYR